MTEKKLHEARLNLSGFLQSRRKEVGMTQEELAELSGMGTRTIQRFESGKFWLNLKQYLTLCYHLGCRIDIEPEE
jgi:transcriptional regulator with XRE-family HTH domain